MNGPAPESPAKTLVNRGALRIAEGDLDAAETLLREAILVDPGNATAHVNLGFVLACRGEHQAAIAEAEEALALDPGRTAAWAHLGMSLLALGRSSDAQAALATAVRLDPANCFAWEALARLHLTEGRVAAAEEAWSAAVAVSPDDVDLLVAWAAALAALGRTTDALRALRRATEADPRSARAWSQLGIVALLHHDHGTAGEALLEALELEPGHTGARFHLALLHLLVGAEDEARAALGQIAAGPSEWSDAATELLGRLGRDPAGPPSTA